jgi:hypothetical protein
MNSGEEKPKDASPTEGELTEEDLDGVSGGIVMPVDIGATKLAPLTVVKTVTPLAPLNGVVGPVDIKTTK